MPTPRRRCSPRRWDPPTRCGMRRLRRGLLRLQRRRAAGGPAGRSPAATRSLVDASRERVGSDPLLVATLRAARGAPDRSTLGARARRCAASAELLAVAGDAARAGESAEQVLWRVWQASGLGRAVERRERARRPVGAAADRDLDAVLALFDAPPATPTGCRAPTSPPSPNTWPSSSCRATRWPPVPRGATPSCCSRRTPPAGASGTSSPCRACRRAPGRTCGCAAACWATSGSSTCSPGSRSPGAPSRASRRCSPRSGGCSTSPAPGPGRRCWSARSKARTSSRPGSSTSSIRCPPDQRIAPVHRAGPGPRARGAGRRAAPGRLHARRAGRSERARRARAAAQLARLAEAGIPGAAPGRLVRRRARCPPTRRCARPARSCRCRPSDVEKILRCPLRWVLERHGGGERGCARGGHRVPGARTGPGRSGGRGRPPSWRRRCARRGRGSTRARRGSAAASWPGCAAMLGAFDELGARPAGRRGCGWSPSSSPCSSTCRATPRWATPGLRLRGRVDRLEVDAAGRPVVVDVKTGRTAVTRARRGRAPAARGLPARGRARRVARRVERGAPPGGARLVYLADRRADGRPRNPCNRHSTGEGSRSGSRSPQTCAADTAGRGFTARVGPDCERCRCAPAAR